MEPTNHPNRKEIHLNQTSMRTCSMLIFRGKIHCCPTFFLMFMFVWGSLCFWSRIRITNPMGVTLTQVNVVCAFCLVNRFWAAFRDRGLVDDGGIFMDFFRISQQLRPEMQVMPIFFFPSSFILDFSPTLLKEGLLFWREGTLPPPAQKNHAAWCINMVPKSANGKHPFFAIHSHKMRCCQLPVGLWRDSSSLTKTLWEVLKSSWEVPCRSTYKIDHLYFYRLVPFLTCRICTVISTINTVCSTNEKRNNVNTGFDERISQSSIQRMPSSQTKWECPFNTQLPNFLETFMNSNSCFFVYHSKYHRIRFGFPVSALWGVEYWHLPFFHVRSLSIHDRWAGW